MSQSNVDNLLRCLLIEEMIQRNGELAAARLLADSANQRLSNVVDPALELSFAKADVTRVLERDPGGHFERFSDQWRVSAAFQRSLAAGEAELPNFSGLRASGVLDKMHQWQREALTEWHRAGRRGIVSAVTGSGKTLLGIAAIEAHVRSPGARAVVLVPTIELMRQWHTQLSRVFFLKVGAVGDGETGRLADYPIVVYVARSGAASLAPQVSSLGDARNVLLVADECHRYGAASYARALKAPFAATLGLSATPERDYDNGMERHVLPALGEVVYDYQHERAVAEGVVSDFRVLFIGVNYEPVEQTKHDELSLLIARAYGTLSTAHPFIKNAGRAFMEAVKTLASRDEDESALRWLSLVAERRRLLCNATQRHVFVEWFVAQPELRDKKMLLFHESIADAQLLADALKKRGIAAAAHHSELERFSRARTLAAFANGSIQAIVSPHTLDEGIDVPDASLAIIVAGTRVKRQNIQRVGRVLRRAADKDQALIVRVFVTGGADDPSGASADRFAKMTLENGRGHILNWPQDSAEIRAFVRRPPHFEGIGTVH